ncbi:hypothetical protein [Nonomuraea dietziae]|uniref:Uncharacterized protein n=1 Tax=Nonomuraea dietziae TaxID=65515 RepID=A0A7W5VHV9_9ACTN|nr:hypothetical protein [Nonomuraea dietziae]MBB3732360.1 hypothetical protein [Nonomuraea dietziae]
MISTYLSSDLDDLVEVRTAPAGEVRVLLGAPADVRHGDGHMVALRQELLAGFPYSAT